MAVTLCVGMHPRTLQRPMPKTNIRRWNLPNLELLLIGILFRLIIKRDQEKESVFLFTSYEKPRESGEVGGSGASYEFLIAKLVEMKKSLLIKCAINNRTCIFNLN